eukprot:s531_g5.t1
MTEDSRVAPQSPPAFNAAIAGCELWRQPLQLLDIMATCGCAADVISVSSAVLNWTGPWQAALLIGSRAVSDVSHDALARSCSRANGHQIEPFMSTSSMAIDLIDYAVPSAYGIFEDTAFAIHHDVADSVFPMLLASSSFGGHGELQVRVHVQDTAGESC